MRNRTARVGALVLSLFVLAACTTPTEDQKLKRENADAAMKSVGGFPYDVVSKNPTELMNVKKKLIADSDPNRLSYIYLIDHGMVMAHFVAKGKVSSSDSQMLPEEEFRDVCGDGCAQWEMVTAAGDDATYGNREPGIFFFTPEGMLVTWSGEYLQFDRPMKVTTPISLVAQVN